MHHFLYSSSDAGDTEVLPVGEKLQLKARPRLPGSGLLMPFAPPLSLALSLTISPELGSNFL